jgi:HD superfamily phosphohydrolase YqeK
MKETLGREACIMKAMERYFGNDNRRIRHARRVTDFAEGLLLKEGGNREVIIAAAILHDIGIKECERKYGSTDGQLQEKEGVPIARKILTECGLSEDVVVQACRIIASHHSPGEIDTLDFKIIWDADWLVNLRDECDIKDRKKLKDIIEKTLLTESGRSKAKEIYCEGEER